MTAVPGGVPVYETGEEARPGDRIESSGLKVVVLEVGPFVENYGAWDLRVAHFIEGTWIAEAPGKFGWHARVCRLQSPGQVLTDVVTDKEEIAKVMRKAFPYSLDR